MIKIAHLCEVFKSDFIKVENCLMLLGEKVNIIEAQRATKDYMIAITLEPMFDSVQISSKGIEYFDEKGKRSIKWYIGIAISLITLIGLINPFLSKYQEAKDQRLRDENPILNELKVVFENNSDEDLYLEKQSKYKIVPASSEGYYDFGYDGLMEINGIEYLEYYIIPANTTAELSFNILNRNEPHDLLMEGESKIYLRIFFKEFPERKYGPYLFVEDVLEDTSMKIVFDR